MEKATQHQTATKSYEWKLTTFERQGNLFVEWSTNAPFRAQKDKIEVYEKGWPSNPDSNSKAWTWADAKNSPWNTGLTYGADWYCARIAQSAPDGPYVYVEQIITK
ncbi:hypothetical protein IMCC3317_37170 [Kordia antarctica]|uniref:Uncharacterized protein n=1 Tax=Kordia antarctica TaxID=1218801 RepID=A0A7L4ZQ83_9FLAO|nr:hypothetical protein [Kordia antarctica]QHI38326.1 hypothetical protein IMCC3317_37170 [Kordia antarctica]